MSDGANRLRECPPLMKSPYKPFQLTRDLWLLDPKTGHSKLIPPVTSVRWYQIHHLVCRHQRVLGFECLPLHWREVWKITYQSPLCSVSYGCFQPMHAGNEAPISQQDDDPVPPLGISQFCTCQEMYTTYLKEPHLGGHIMTISSWIISLGIKPPQLFFFNKTYIIKWRIKYTVLHFSILALLM